MSLVETALICLKAFPNATGITVPAMNGSSSDEDALQELDVMKSASFVTSRKPVMEQEAPVTALAAGNAGKQQALQASKVQQWCELKAPCTRSTGEKMLVVPLSRRQKQRCSQCSIVPATQPLRDLWAGLPRLPCSRKSLSSEPRYARSCTPSSRMLVLAERVANPVVMLPAYCDLHVCECCSMCCSSLCFVLALSFSKFALSQQVVYLRIYPSEHPLFLPSRIFKQLGLPDQRMLHSVSCMWLHVSSLPEGCKSQGVKLALCLTSSDSAEAAGLLCAAGCPEDAAARAWQGQQSLPAASRIPGAWHRAQQLG